MRMRLSRVGATCAVALAMACDAGDDAPTGPREQPGQAAAIHISAPGQSPGQTFAILAGQSLRLQVSVVDAQGRVMRGLTPELTTRNAKVATIDSTGLLTTTGSGVTHVVGRVISNGRTVSDSLTVLVACTSEFRYGLSVMVTDSISGALVNAPADFYLRDGAYVDSARAHPSGYWMSAGERAGTYELTVRAQGYREWTRSGIVVTRGICHVDGVSVTARLQRL